MFDVLTIAAVSDELSATILDGRIQKIGLADNRTLTAEVYAGGRRRTLIASAEDQAPRVLLSGSSPAIDSALSTPLVLLLRKYARGGVIIGVEQPPLERIVHLSIAKRIGDSRDRDEAALERGESEDLPDEDDEESIYGVEAPTFVHLYIEIMGRHSNIILVDDDGQIMESIKRVTPAMSRVRPIQPRRSYVPPPPMDRPDPRRVTADQIRDLLIASRPDATLANWLVRSFRAMSPQMAREIAFLASGATETPLNALLADASATIARSMRQLLEPLVTSAWAPHVYRDEDGLPVAFAPVPMQHLAAHLAGSAVDSISEAAAQVIADTGAGPAGRHDARKKRLLDAIGSLRERVQARLQSLLDESNRAATSDRYREWGDLIYAYLWQIQPGQSSLDVDGVSIPLDPAKTAKENAQEYFERYRKGRDAGAQLPQRIERARTDLQYLDQLALHIQQAETFPEIESLQIEWERYRATAQPGARDQRATRRSAPPRRIRPLFDAEGNAVFIGRSGAQNDEVTFSIAGPNDTWVHARGVPGSHVVIRWRNAAADDRAETIEAAARLAAYYSSARSGGLAEVDVAKRRHVRKIKGAGPGMVTYRNETTIAVRPGSESDLAGVLSGPDGGSAAGGG